jgi:hypothetical protein
MGETAGFRWPENRRLNLGHLEQSVSKTMRVPVLVTGVEKRHGVKDGRQWEMTTVTAVDMSPTGKCSTPLEFTLQEEDKDLSDKLDGQRLEVDVRKIGTYKGRLDISARIVRVSGSDAKPQGQPKG